MEREVRQDLARRNETERQLQQHIDTELQGLSERLTGQMSELQMMVKNGMDNLNRTVDDLSSALAAEQEQRKLDIDHVGSSLCTRLDEVVQTVDDERFARLEQERQSLRRYVSLEKVLNFCILSVCMARSRAFCTFRIGEDLYKLNERVECERKCREHAVGELSGELQDFAATHGAQEEQRTMRLTEELGCLRTKLSAETADRMQEDEAIVHAINEYTKALQAGLRIVGST